MRTADISRKTAETDISLSLCLEGAGRSEIHTGCGFFDHMLTLFAAHGRFDLTLSCRGDMQVDCHHTVEDCGIALGEAFRTALGNRAGIVRYGDISLPMDEALVLCAVDLSGRAWACCGVSIPAAKVGDFDTEMTEEFFWAFARALGAAVHFRQFSGQNSHHILEAMFKGFGRAMRTACSLDPGLAGEIPSTKGLL